MFHFRGAKSAIALAIAVTLIQVLYHKIKLIKPSAFFIVASGFTVGFGTIDLFLARPRVFKLEPFAQNALMGAVFLVSGFARKPIAEWFISGLPARYRPAIGPGMHDYLRKLTLIWAAYFFAKGFFFLWLAYQVDLGKLIVLRSIIGSVTLLMMFGGELAYRRFIRGKSPKA